MDSLTTLRTNLLIYSLGDCKPTPPAIPAGTISLRKSTVEIEEENMENTMNTVDNTTVARRALTRAVSNTYYKTEREALKTYGFIETRKPKDAQELIEWIKAGDYIAPDTSDEDYDSDNYKYDTFLGITFPPKVKKDRDGYDKHMADFYKDKTAIELEIEVLEPAEALKSYKKFESKWIH